MALIRLCRPQMARLHKRVSWDDSLTCQGKRSEIRWLNWLRSLWFGSTSWSGDRCGQKTVKTVEKALLQILNNAATIQRNNTIGHLIRPSNSRSNYGFIILGDSLYRISRICSQFSMDPRHRPARFHTLLTAKSGNLMIVWCARYVPAVEKGNQNGKWITLFFFLTWLRRMREGRISLVTDHRQQRRGD